MKKNLLVVSMILLLTFILSACGNVGNSKSVGDFGRDKLKVAVSFNPLKEFAYEIGKDKIDVITLVGSGVEPHDFELKLKDMKILNEAQVFMYNGLGMEPWVENAVKNLDNKKLIVVEASENCNKLTNSEVQEIEEHGQYDPHIWLSLKEAKIQALNIKEAFVKADTVNKDFYEKNYKEFALKLDELYNEYKTKFDGLTNKNFVTGHAAFAYLCRDFGLKQSSIEGVFSEGEPTAAQIAQLVEYCKKNNVKTVFSEELASPKVSATLAKEIGGNVQKIYTIESREDNKNYLESMKANLERIYDSLK